MSSCVYVLNKTSLEVNFTSWSYSAGNEMHKKGCCRCTVKPIAFVTFSLLLPSWLLNLSLFKGVGRAGKCRLFSQAKLQVNLTFTLPFVLCTNCTCNGRFARFFSISSLRLKKSLVCQKQIPLTSIQVRTFARFYLRDHGC